MPTPIKKSRVEKPYNHGTMSTAAFWGWIRSSLRQRSRFWKPVQECKKKARRAYKGDNKRVKWEYLCNHCKKYYLDKEVEINHIIPAGSLKSAEDLPGFVTRLFCEIDHLECICKTCHLKETAKQRMEK